MGICISKSIVVQLKNDKLQGVKRRHLMLRLNQHDAPIQHQYTLIYNEATFIEYNCIFHLIVLIIIIFIVFVSFLNIYKMVYSHLELQRKNTQDPMILVSLQYFQFFAFFFIASNNLRKHYYYSVIGDATEQDVQQATQRAFSIRRRNGVEISLKKIRIFRCRNIDVESPAGKQRGTLYLGSKSILTIHYVPL